jgi:hypothetical protein
VRKSIIVVLVLLAVAVPVAIASTVGGDSSNG